MGAPAPRRRARDHKAALAAAALPQRSVELCLRGDLVAELQELQRDLNDADRQERAAAAEGGSVGRALELSQQITALREEMLEHTIVVRFRAMPRKAKRKLIAEHPPREDNERDRLLGFDEEAVTDALLRACAFDPVLDDEDWARFDEVLSDGQWASLTNAVWSLNNEDFEVPFSARASQILASSAPE